MTYLKTKWDLPLLLADPPVRSLSPLHWSLELMFLGTWVVLRRQAWPSIRLPFGSSFWVLAVTCGAEAVLSFLYFTYFPILFHISLLPLWVPKAFLLFPFAMSHSVIFYSLPVTYKQLKTNNKSAQSAFHDRNWCDHVDPLHLSLGSKPSIEVDYLWCQVTALKSINKRIISTPH